MLLKASRVQNAYGTTEFPGISVNGVIADGVEIKLEDVPGMYTHRDTPYPRGQILVRHKTGSSYLSGYYKDPQATAESFTSDGWYKTGDIGLLNSDHSHLGRPTLEIIDRLTNMIEMYHNGDSLWLNPSPLEMLYAEAKGVRDHQLVLLNDRNEEGIIAACVVESHSVTEESILDQLSKMAKKNKIPEIQVPRGVVLLYEPWTISNGHLSPLGKPLRRKLAVSLKPFVDLKYVEIKDRHTPKNSVTSVNEEVKDGPIESLRIDDETLCGESLVEDIICRLRVTDVPQNLNVSDFLDFTFTNNDLNAILSELKEMVRTIRCHMSEVFFIHYITSFMEITADIFNFLLFRSGCSRSTRRQIKLFVTSMASQKRWKRNLWRLSAESSQQIHWTRRHSEKRYTLLEYTNLGWFTLWIMRVVT